jgi:signal transduction histidine kinase
VIARLVGAYLAIFAVVLAAISLALFFFLGAQYHSLLLPALSTPEGAAVYAHTLRGIALEIGAIDAPLLIVVGIASWALARLSVGPLLAARARERTFIADAAHELRSPLAAIASVAQAARGERDEARVLDAFQTIATTALDASALVGDLLTLARTPQPAMLDREPVDLAAVAHACLREFESRASGAGLQLDLHLQSAIVDGDARRLRELLRNLLENALRHASGRIVVATGIEGGRAYLRVSDDGAGVAAGLRDRLFERFVTGSEGGTGLGLAIARWVASAHEGTLTLEERRPGASFVAQFPIPNS